MKTLSKKVLLICLLVLTAVFTGLLAACSNGNDDHDHEKDQPTTVTYTVTVTDDNDAPVKDVAVYLKKGSARYDNVKTSAEGKASFELEGDTYEVGFVASTLPAGYTAPESLQVTKEAPSVTAKLVKQFSYVVKLVDEDGNPFYHQDVYVAICQINGSCLTPSPLGEGGVWTMTGATPGDYKVQINLPDDIADKYTFDGNAADSHYYSGKHFSATETEMTIVIKKATEITLTGATTKTITVESADKTARIIFAPAQTGVYEITSEGSYDTKAVYYASAVAMIKTGEDDDSGEGKNFKFSGLEYSQVGPSSAFIISVKEGATFPATFNVKITRTGDAQQIVVRTPQKVTPAELGQTAYEAAGLYNEVDLASAQMVVKGTDGFYHLDDAQGPVLVVKLAKPFRNFGAFTAQLEGGRAAAASFYMGFADYASETIFWDYTEFFTAYSAKCNSDGVYGVNEELKIMLDRWAGAYINEHTFGIEALGTIAKGNEWLIPCGYYVSSELTGEGTENSPYILGYGAFNITVPANGTVYLSMNFGKYTVKAEAESAFTINSDEFTATQTENGYTFNCEASRTGGIARFTLTNGGNSAITVKITASEPAKDSSNALKLGTNEVTISASDYYDGATFTFTPEEDGRYVISSSDASAAILYDADGAYEGDGMDFGFAFTIDAMADETYSFKLSAMSQEGATYTVVVNKELDLGENEVTIYSEDDLYDGTVFGFSPVESGKYVIYCTDPVMLLYSDVFNGYTGDSQMDGNGFAFVGEFKGFENYYFLLLSDATTEYYVTIAKYDEASIKVGENTVNAISFGSVYAFTAEESGTYKITSTDANAALLSGFDFTSNDYTSAVNITLNAEAGKTYFFIFSVKGDNGSYKVTVTKVEENNG